jgi:hypothetical protein
MLIVTLPLLTLCPAHAALPAIAIAIASPIWIGR